MLRTEKEKKRTGGTKNRRKKKEPVDVVFNLKKKMDTNFIQRATILTT
jgi:hypothetical protein